MMSGGGFDPCVCSRVNLLESFYYVADWQTRNIHNFKSFMLDSGAFTFMQHAEKAVDWDEYLSRYIQYINANDVSLFFELDIDSVVGYERVLVMRDRLERETGRRCIPVWHVNRGWDEWLRMCDEYEYVAIGGIADRGRVKVEPYVRRFTKEAHRRGAKVHGLGYTKLSNLESTGFDSVDSTTWLYGNRIAHAYEWNGNEMRRHATPKGKRMNSKAIARHNFLEWVKMAESLESRCDT